MGDIRDQLNARLHTLRAQEPALLHDLDYGHPDHRYIAASRSLGELRQIEGILATYQLADAQMKLVAAQERATEAQRDATEAQLKANEVESQARSQSEEETFWTRRFLNTIALASAAAFVSVLTFATKTDSPHVPTEDLGKMLFAFGAAASLGAVTPLYQLTEIRRRKLMERIYAIPNDHPAVEGRMTNFLLRLLKLAGNWDKARWFIPTCTAFLFVLGMMVVMGSVNGYLVSKPVAEQKSKVVEVRVVNLPVVEGASQTPPPKN